MAMGLRQDDFFAKFFAIFDDFKKWSMPKVLRDFEKLSNMAKHEEKSCSTCLQSIFSADSSRYQKMKIVFHVYPFLHFDDIFCNFFRTSLLKKFRKKKIFAFDAISRLFTKIELFLRF